LLPFRTSFPLLHPLSQNFYFFPTSSIGIKKATPVTPLGSAYPLWRPRLEICIIALIAQTTIFFPFLYLNTFLIFVKSPVSYKNLFSDKNQTEETPTLASLALSDGLEEISRCTLSDRTEETLQACKKTVSPGWNELRRKMTFLSPSY